MDKTVFWEKNHSNCDKYWLTGSTLSRVMNYHALSNITNLKVLEIGIGVGTMTEQLHLANNEVFACDISTEALKKVETFAKVYTTEQLELIEPVDLAICHLVFQHCDDNEIERIIKSVNLKEKGIFSFQFAWIRENDPPNSKVQEFINNKTHYFRSLDTIKQMVEKSNKQICSISKPMHFYQPENFSWYIVKVCNK